MCTIMFLKVLMAAARRKLFDLCLKQISIQFHIFRWSKIPGTVSKADLSNKYEHDKQDDTKLVNGIL